MANLPHRPTIADRPEPAFDPSVLVSQKPSSLPTIYEFIVTSGRTTPKAIQRDLGVSKSVAHLTLDKLREVGLVRKIGRGQYALADIALDPDPVHVLGELRSKKQYDICRLSTELRAFDVAELRARIGSSRSNVRATAVRLHDAGFLNQLWEPFEKSPKEYRVTDQTKRALATIDVDAFLGRDGRRVSLHRNGIEATDFRTAYEIEDAHYISQSADEWVEPAELAEALDKHRKKTARRLTRMEERGLVVGRARREKMVFEATEKTDALFYDLDLFGISKTHGLDIYSIAKRRAVTDAVPIDELYSALVEMGCAPSAQQLHAAKRDLKSAGLIEGNSRTGYSFSRG